MFVRAGKCRSWTRGGLTLLLAAFVLLLQSAVAAPCERSRAVSAFNLAAEAHCAEMAGEPRGDTRAPAPDEAGCCECLAAGLPVLPPPPNVVAASVAVSSGRLDVRSQTLSLRAIASGPPSQAPPVQI